MCNIDYSSMVFDVLQIQDSNIIDSGHWEQKNEYWLRRTTWICVNIEQA